MTKTRKIVYAVFIMFLLSVLFWSYTNNINIVRLVNYKIDDIKALFGYADNEYKINKIKRELENASYCKEASDCVVVSASGKCLIIPATYLVVNKNEVSKIQKIIDDYQPGSCGIPSYGIGPVNFNKGIIKCVESHCRRIFD